MDQRTLDPDRVAALLLLTAQVVLVVPVGLAALQQGEPPVPWTVAVLTGLTCSLLLTVASVATRTVPRPAAVVLVAVTLAGLLTLPSVSTAPYPPGTKPWVLSLVPTAVATCLLLSRRDWVAPLAAGTLVAAQLRVQLGGTWHVPTSAWVGDALFAGALLAIAYALLTSFRTAAADLRRAQSVAMQEFVRARSAESLTRVATLWDAYLHDEVIATLATIAEGDAARGREAARRVLAGLPTLDLTGIPAPDLADGLLEATLTRFPGAETDLRATQDAAPLPNEVVLALLDAAEEALRNVAEHAYPTDHPGKAWVRLRHGSSGVRLIVADAGAGFAAESVAPTALGIALAISGRMASVGGRATVASEPGRGTRVLLTWNAAGGER